MLPEQFKNEFNQYLKDVFDIHSSIIVDSLSIKTDISCSKDYRYMYIPAIYGNEVIRYMQDNGINIKKWGNGVYIASIYF